MRRRVPFTVIIRSHKARHVETRNGQIWITFCLPNGGLDLHEPYYCRLTHVSGLDNEKLLVKAATLLQGDVVCDDEVYPILGTSDITSNENALLHDYYLQVLFSLKPPLLHSKLTCLFRPATPFASANSMETTFQTVLTKERR